MKTTVTLEFRRLLSMREASRLMILAGELGCGEDEFLLKTDDDGKPIEQWKRRCTKCGREVGLKVTPESWFWDTMEDDCGITITQCGKCNGTVTKKNRVAFIEEMKEANEV